MSRTINTMPLDIQRLEAAGLRPPHDVRARSWGQRPQLWRRTSWAQGRPAGHRAALADWERRRQELLAEAEELDPTFWQRGYGGAMPGRAGYARLLNRRYRAQVKNSIRQESYDRINPPMREAAWLVW